MNYGVPFARILEKIDCVKTALHCIENAMRLPCCELSLCMEGIAGEDTDFMRFRPPGTTRLGPLPDGLLASLPELHGGMPTSSLETCNTNKRFMTFSHARFIFQNVSVKLRWNFLGEPGHIMAADDLAPYVARSSAILVLNIQYEQILDFWEDFNYLHNLSVNP